MKKMSYLFAKCNSIDYDVVGEDVNYKFIEEGRTLYIYFQGSSSVTDWIRNFLFGKKPYKDMKIPYRVHRGFLKAWKEVEDLVIEKITERKLSTANTLEEMSGILVNQEYQWKEIIIVGYSHGGALAQFAHECVWFYRPDLRKEGLTTYAFEAPRIYAGYRVKKSLRERWTNCFVIRNNNDIVTHCPPRLFGYADINKEQMIQIHGDISSVTQWYIPKCIKSHYPQPVYDGLVKYEK